MSQARTPRRPAILDAARAEAIIGDEDPAELSAVAHSTAWALLGVEDDTFGEAEIARLREVVRSQGVDVVAHVWSRSPEFTLPGALWRLYLLAAWYHRHPADVQSRYDEGSRSAHIPGLEAPVAVRFLESVIDEVDALLRGDLSDDDLDWILSAAARVLRVLAAGHSHSGRWIVDPTDALAYPVTTRIQALVRTADELDAAAREAEVGTLN
ncbi:hypothetical protein [Schaalia sp. ZJ1691]|uniref:hypothetical protein n=1 Tax=Schaalia sp. ZJ1691 TaxID=2709404 RepID=UPI0013EAFADA|nr:hypothetical protein [Schaalia sp. ZJ1691]